jgi:FkbM family methyltransferase
MILVGGKPFGGEGDVQFRGLFYPEGTKLTRHMEERLLNEPFYQHDKFHQAMAAVSKGRRRIAVDCGAWVGGWSQALSGNFFRVVSIEANPDNARCVAKNTEACGNVMVLNLAVGDTNGSISVDPLGGFDVGTRVSDGQGVDLRRIDDIAELRELPHLDYLKIHVNGMELRTLVGAEATIHKHKPVMTVVLKAAIEEYGDTAEAAREFLGKLDYRPAGGERPYEIWVPN